MPDWDNLVREHMKALDLPADLKEDVFAELSAHLEDASADVADQQTLHQLPNHGQWRKLSLAIQRAQQQGLMNDRIKRFWLLMAATWLTASLSVMILQRPDLPLRYLILFYLPWLAALPLVCAAVAYLAHRADPISDHTKRLWLSVTVTWLGASLSFMVLLWVDHPNLVLRRPVLVLLSLPWLTTLLLVGAAGAYLAQRADAPRKNRLLISTSPALLLGIVMLLLLPWRLAADGYTWALTWFAMDVESLVVAPGLILLLGALPFLWQRSGNSPCRGDARTLTCSTALPE
jgi:hypothetical protein